MLFLKKKFWLCLAVIIGFVGLGAGSISAQAKAEPVFPRKTITYHISSTGSYYRSVWRKAVKDWNKVKVVKLVKTGRASDADLILTTTKSAGYKDSYHIGSPYDYGKGHFVTKEGKDGVLTQTQDWGYSLRLSRKLMKHMYYDKTERSGWAETAIGDVLGLNWTKHSNSVMNNTSFKSDKPTKYDKKNLKKLYKNIPF